MASIIIPARNEARVIGETLSALLGQIEPNDEVLVVCNGCEDGTAEVARGFGGIVKVLETPVASKTHALNLGDGAATTFPRLYLDADVRLMENAWTCMKVAMSDARFMAASPVPIMDFSGSTLLVRAYYRIWLSLPYCQSGMMGAGAYMLTEKGRRRFDAFPDLISDDGFVRAQFREEERGRVEGAVAQVRAPANLKWLLKIKTRSRLGVMELRARFPQLAGNEEKDYAGGLYRLMARPKDWPALVAYVSVTLLIRWLARKRFTNLSQYEWEKDESSH